MSYFIIIRGPLGCGKSTLSAELAEKLNAEHFEIDTILDEYNLTKDKEDGYISQKSFRKANDIVFDDVIGLLQRGTPIVFDGNFYWKSHVEDMIERLQFPHYIFTLKAPLDVCIDRYSKREISHGEMEAMVVHKKTSKFDFGTLIDVTKALPNSLHELISYLPKL